MSSFSKSPWVIHYDASSCNGCDIEVLDALTPRFDAERLGVVNTGNPKHADIFLVTGSVNERNVSVVKEIYNQMVEPKAVVAVGICACSAGIFHDCYNIIGGVDQAIPVDVYVPGCAARPEAIIDGIVEAVGVLEEKAAKLKVEKKAYKKQRKLELREQRKLEKAEAKNVKALNKAADDGSETPADAASKAGESGEGPKHAPSDGAPQDAEEDTRPAVDTAAETAEGSTHPADDTTAETATEKE